LSRCIRHDGRRYRQWGSEMQQAHQRSKDVRLRARSPVISGKDSVKSDRDAC
jgi:hypothetical protein